MGLDCSSSFVYNQLAFFLDVPVFQYCSLCFQIFPVFKHSCVSVFRCSSL